MPVVDLATLADLKSHLNIPAGDTTQDTELQGFLDAATPVIENITGPIVAKTVTAERHSGGTGSRSTILLRQRPVTAVTTVVEFVGNYAQTVAVVADPSAATAYSCTFDPETGQLTRRVSGGQTYPWAWGEDNIYVTYTAGYATVPANVRLAALFQAAHLYQSSQLGGRPSWGSSAGADDAYAALPASYAVPNRVRELLDGNQRIPGMA